MNKIQDKIRGNFLGVAIGDALGKPAESMTPDQIQKRLGRITDYLDCSSHKYFQDDKKGTTTDDWQLTKAIAKAMIKTGKFDLDQIAVEHCKEFAVSVRGWGSSTREAVEKISNGTHWSEAGKTDIPNRGLGNGVCMKATPAGLYIALTNPELKDESWTKDLQAIADMAIMTHDTSIAITSGIAHAFATYKCFESTPENFDSDAFVRAICGAADIGRQFRSETLKDDLHTRFSELNIKYEPATIINPEKFGGGTCYVYDSLPFTYAWFLRNPHSIESLYDCINGGGDTDSNGSMIGGLLGCLHGVSIFPQHLIDGLECKDEVLEIADQFYERFGKHHGN